MSEQQIPDASRRALDRLVMDVIAFAATGASKPYSDEQYIAEIAMPIVTAELRRLVADVGTGWPGAALVLRDRARSRVSELEGES